MRLLVTGISGQVGNALSATLTGHQLIAADRAMLDLARPKNIPQILDALAPALIINAGAYTAVDLAEEERDLATLVNADAPGVMARWAAGQNVPLLHFSTDYVFDGGSEHTWREEDKPNPLSVYGATKLAGEEAIRAEGGPSLIMRTSWVYAARGRNFLRTIARLSREQKELRIVADQIGAPTSAKAIAGATARLLAHGLEGFHDYCKQAKGLLHFSAAGETSWCGFATAIVDGLRERRVPIAVERVQPITTDQYPTKAKRPLNSRLDLTRFRTLFGTAPQPWQDALCPELDLLVHDLP